MIGLPCLWTSSAFSRCTLCFTRPHFYHGRLRPSENDLYDTHRMNRAFFSGCCFLFGAALMVLVMQGSPDSQASPYPAPPSDPLSRLVGSAKEVFGDTLFLKADSYFHGGAEHENHHDDTAAQVEKEGELEGKTEVPQDWIARINHEVGANDLVHLAKDKRREMLPFFALSTSLDPYNVEAILTTAFWLEREFEKPGDALQVLKKGAQDNPDSWEIENALGRFYMKRSDNASAHQHFQAALQKAGNVSMEDFEREALHRYLEKTKSTNLNGS